MAAYTLVFHGDEHADPVQIEKPGTVYPSAALAFHYATQFFTRFTYGGESFNRGDRLVSIEVHRDGAMIYELKNHD